ncbi:MAG: hypothetical protein HYW38_02390 [Candidatus Colwellbacteria bacterium]|nr:hypothetical protein [Candidatus Colwellbacteria bacterium]
MGSKFFFKTAEDFYILGLWLADGYWRTSSIGLTSVDQRLVNRFTNFLLKVAPSHPVKERIYLADGKSKRKQTAVQVYINSRSLTRVFLTFKTGDLNVPRHYLVAYLAGRIDGDGHIDTKHRTGIRIAYSSREDARRDQLLFGEANVSLYQYQAARTFVLYLKKSYREQVLSKLKKYSVKLAP